MRTIVYKNYDTNCPYLPIFREDPFADCINPAVFSEMGAKNRWVTNCTGCPHKSLVNENFGYKVAILGVKLEEAYGNVIKKNGGKLFE
jgi:hypothetical protein